MSVTIVTRWSTPNIAATIDLTRRAKAVWMSQGAEAFRVNQVFTGEFTGHVLVAIVFPDLATYASAQLKAATDMQPIFAETAKSGGVLHERVILMGLDV